MVTRKDTLQNKPKKKPEEGQTINGKFYPNAPAGYKPDTPSQEITFNPDRTVNVKFREPDKGVMTTEQLSQQAYKDLLNEQKNNPQGIGSTPFRDILNPQSAQTDRIKAVYNELAAKNQAREIKQGLIKEAAGNPQAPQEIAPPETQGIVERAANIGLMPADLIAKGIGAITGKNVEGNREALAKTTFGKILGLGIIGVGGALAYGAITGAGAVAEAGTTLGALKAEIIGAEASSAAISNGLLSSTALKLGAGLYLVDKAASYSEKDLKDNTQALSEVMSGAQASVEDLKNGVEGASASKAQMDLALAEQAIRNLEDSINIAKIASPYRLLTGLDAQKVKLYQARQLLAQLRFDLQLGQAQANIGIQ
jgi:hypothetical protein